MTSPSAPLFVGADASSPRGAASGAEGKRDFRANATQWAVFAALLAAPARDNPRLDAFLSSRRQGAAVEPLTPTADIRRFSCGVAVLDDALRREAKTVSPPGDEFVSRTFVMLRERRVVAYLTLRLCFVRRAAAEAEAFPIMQLQRLAVDRTAQGLGLGTAMLHEAVMLAIPIGERCGARVLCVHALSPEVRRFYLERGLQPMPAIIDPLGVLLTFDDVRRASAG